MKNDIEVNVGDLFITIPQYDEFDIFYFLIIGKRLVYGTATEYILRIFSITESYSWELNESSLKYDIDHDAIIKVG